MKAMHELFDSVSEDEINIEKDELFEMIGDAIDMSINDHLKERIPEYGKIYESFTVHLVFKFGRLIDIGMPQQDAEKIMDLVNSHKIEAQSETGLEGKVEALKSIRPPVVDINDLQGVPERFRK